MNQTAPAICRGGIIMVNGERYSLVGGTRESHFSGTNLKPHNLPENAASPTRRMHAVLGAFYVKIIFLINVSSVSAEKCSPSRAVN
jgi:hypothetical protein